MKLHRFTIPCLDGKRRYVFCRSMNSAPQGSTDTGTAIISTENRGNAFVAYGPESARKNLEYFTQYSHGLKVEIES